MKRICHKAEWQASRYLLLLSPLAEAVIFESTVSQEVCRGFSQQI